MKFFLILGIIMVLIIGLGTTSMAEAHPHATIDLMESHSHDPSNENFQEEFILHDFEHVILSAFEFIKSILFG